MSEAPVTDTPSQPSMQGKLMEVDIPDESRAIKECQPQYSQKRGPKKQRLGPGDKPWRSRNRRGSDDIKRDQLVEKFLSENRRKPAPLRNMYPYITVDLVLILL